MAIKKGFDGVALPVDEEEKKYDSKDVQKVYLGVIKKISKDYKIFSIIPFIKIIK